jgi:hypothetical protein
MMINKMYPDEDCNEGVTSVLSPKPRYKFKELERKYSFLKQHRGSCGDTLAVYGGEAVLKEPQQQLQ